MSEYQIEELAAGNVVLRVCADAKRASLHVSSINADNQAAVFVGFSDPDRRDDFYRFLLRAARKVGETLGGAL